MADWRTYSVEDFVPFTSDVYFRLIERVNEALWPLHGLTLFGGIAVVVLLLLGRGGAAAALLLAVWSSVGIAFFLERYAELTWAGVYFGWAFCLEGLILLVCGLAGRFNDTGAHRFTGPQWVGFALIATGLIVYPTIAILGGGEDWSRSEVFGIHADPTAVATLGILLIAAKGWSLWVSAVVPILWCVAGGLTLQVLEAPWAPGLFAVAVLALVSTAYSGKASRHRVKRRAQ